MRPRTLLIAILLLVPSAGFATTVLKVPVEEMTRTAALVIQAVVTDVQAVPDPEDARRISTHVTLKISRVFKGTAAAPTLTLKLLGGRYQGFTMWVPGMPGFSKGEEVVLFLETTSKGFIPSGLSLGKYTVSRDSQGRERARRFPEGAVHRLEGGQLVSAPPSAEDDLDLDDLLARIRRGVATQTPKQGGIQ